MAFNFAKAKQLARRTVHKALGVRAFYKDNSISSSVEIKARWHNKIILGGDLDNEGYADIVQGVDRIVFEATEARRIGLKRGGEISFADEGAGAGLGVAIGTPLGGEGVSPAVFVLQNLEPNTGPFEEVWSVTRKGSV